jgi:hypothetical protein
LRRGEPQAPWPSAGMPDPQEALAVRLRDRLLQDAADPDAPADGDLNAQICVLVRTRIYRGSAREDSNL